MFGALLVVKFQLKITAFYHMCLSRVRW